MCISTINVFSFIYICYHELCYGEMLVLNDRWVWIALSFGLVLDYIASGILKVLFVSCH